MKILKVKHNWLRESGQRLDASYHLSDGPITKLKLKNSPYPLTILSKETEDIFSGNIFKRTYVESEKFGLPYLTGSDMMKSDINSGKFISKKYTKQQDKLALEKGWILITCSGTLGNTVFTNSNFEEKIATHDLIRVVPNNKNTLPGFLYAYLTSKYGHGLLTQSSYGGVVKHIEPHHIKNLPIPVFPMEKQEKINNLILEASDMRVKGEALLSEAVEYFDDKFPSNGMQKIFVKKIKELNFSFAAYNNNSEVSEIESQIFENFTISEVATKCFAPPMFKHIYLDKDNGHPFLTGAELTKFHKKFYRWLSPRGVKNISDYKVKKGTLLLYKSGTTDGGILGNVFLADDILENACLSDHVIRISTKDIKLSYWIYAFLKSKPGIKLLQRIATGSMIPFITPERLLDLKIPKPDGNFKWVTEKIDGYLNAIVNCQLNEIKAIHLVEKEIESWQK